VLADGYAVTAAHEATHWWFQSRRELCLRQVARAVGEATPGRRARLLDYGCGTGFDLAHLAAYGDVAGADLGTALATAARRDARFPVYEMPGDLDRLRAVQDVVTAFDVLEHVDDDVGLLQASLRALKPGGAVVVTVPAHQSLWTQLDEASGHKRRYSRDTLARSMRAAGLEVTLSRYFKPINPQQLQQALAAAAQKPNAEMVYAQAEADKVRAQIVKILTDARVKTLDMGLKDDRERDKLDQEAIIAAADLQTKGAQLDLDAIQMAVDATRPEEEKATTEGIPKPDTAMLGASEQQPRVLPRCCRMARSERRA